MSRKSKRILLTLASAAVGAACGAAVYFIRKGKADLETDFDDLKTNLKRKSLLLLNVLIRPFRKRKVRRMLHRIRNLQLAIKVPKQLIQKLKAKPQSPKKKTLKKKAVRIVKFLHRKKAK